MQQITIEMDESGLITLTIERDGEQPETMEASSAQEAADMVAEALGAGAAEEPMQAQPGSSSDAEMAWNDEAAKRPQNPNLMA